MTLPKPKAPDHIIEAWVDSVRHRMKAQSIRAKAAIMFDTGESVLMVRAEQYHKLAGQIESAADLQFVKALRAEWKGRFIIDRYSSRCTVTAWPPHGLAVMYTFTRHTKKPVKTPYAFARAIVNGKRGK